MKQRTEFDWLDVVALVGPLGVLAVGLLTAWIARMPL